MCSRHQFIRAAPIVNNRTSVSIVTVQSLIARVTVVLGANYPDNHVVGSVRRSNKWRAAPPVLPCGCPAVPNRGRVSSSNAKSYKRATIGAESDISALLGPVSNRCLDDEAIDQMA